MYAGEWGQLEQELARFGLSASIRSATGGSAVSAETNTSWLLLKSLATLVAITMVTGF